MTVIPLVSYLLALVCSYPTTEIMNYLHRQIDNDLAALIWPKFTCSEAMAYTHDPVVKPFHIYNAPDHSTDAFTMLKITLPVQKCV